MSELEGKTMLCAASVNDACKYYRLRVPKDALADDSIVWAHQFNDDNGLTQLSWPELKSLRTMVIQRPVNDSVAGLVDGLSRQTIRPRIVIELDDDLWSIPSHNSAREYYQPLLGNLSRIISMADRVVVSTSALADAVRTHAWPREVVVVPNMLPDSVTWGAVTEPRQHLVFSGGQTHARDLEPVARSLRPMLRKREISMTFLGTDYGVPYTTHFGWTDSMAAHYRRLASFSGSVGLAPLKRDTFNLSKSDIRLLEYAAAGILPLATNYGPYADRPVMYVGEHEQWKYAVTRSLTAPRLELVRVAQDWARTRLVSKNLDQWRHAWYLT